MATKEEIEGELKELREQHEKLKMRYKEVATKLQVARFALQAQADVMDSHLKPSKPADYNTGREELNMEKVKSNLE